MSRPSLEFRVVGIGASAGGLDALTRLVSALRDDTGCAFVILQHQAESQVGKLATILAPLAAIPIVDVESGLAIAPDRVFVVPPHTQAALVDGAFVLAGPQAASPRLPIDGLMHSIAEAARSNAIGVVLSGTGRDGTDGLRAIRDVGGISVAQEPSTAEFDEMPRNAIGGGAVDVVLPPERIGGEITVLREATRRPAIIARILEQLREHAGIDFSTYKPSTIERRLERQMARHHLASLEQYAGYLAAHPDEVRAVYEDLLVHVTEFFRDPAVFERLVSHVIPALLDAKPAGAPIRAWVPGCSTGEEVYSIAIVLLEVLEQRGDKRSIQLFGTDLSERAIEIARAGRYLAASVQRLDAARLARFFVRDGADWRISPRVRERCVFVRHDIATEPPFSHLDLVSCRNVLIYMGTALQQRVVPLFHFALEQPGYLVLGSSETILAHHALFTQVEPGQPLFLRRPAAPRPSLVFGGRHAQTRRIEAMLPSVDVFREADHVLLARYAPACVLVDEHFDVVQFRGRTGAYLEPTPGPPQLNVFKMAREGLAHELRSLALRAQRDALPVRSEDVAFGDDGERRRVDLAIVPLRSNASAALHYIILFEERASAARAVPSVQPARHGTTDRVEQLQHELAAAHEYLTSVVTQHAATMDELGVLNEELQSTNEELQSSNEELHTAKEELHATNDELVSLNVELEKNNQALEKVNDDLANVIANVDLAVVIVDENLCVRRFTPTARTLFKLVDSDLGRPISDLQPSVHIDDLASALANVIATDIPLEREVRDAAGHFYRMHVRPYRKSEQQQTEGAVLSFVDVTALRQNIEARERARDAERAAEVALAREKDALLDMVSHELRTPLSAILLWTAVIRQKSRDPDVLRATETIELCARSEAQLVDDLLDVALSRTNSDAVGVAVQTIEAAPIVEAAVTSLRASADDKRIRISVSADALSAVRADPRRLRQIAWHLVANAIKFTPPEGEIRVAVTRHDGVVQLVVHDNGQGIHEAFLPRVFDAFAREDESSTREHAGLGVGLAFVRHLVERQAGTIRADSDGPQRGSTFTVQLPAAP